jgi:hypothetical protein
MIIVAIFSKEDPKIEATRQADRKAKLEANRQLLQEENYDTFYLCRMYFGRCFIYSY